MKITVTLDQDEIKQAIKHYVCSQKILTVDDSIDVDLVGTKGNHSAVIAIDNTLLVKPEGQDMQDSPAAVQKEEPASEQVKEEKEDLVLISNKDFPEESVADLQKDDNPFAADDLVESESTDAANELPDADVDSLFG
jgi:hypothetical protein